MPDHGDHAFLQYLNMGLLGAANVKSTCTFCGGKGYIEHTGDFGIGMLDGYPGSDVKPCPVCCAESSDTSEAK